ncbi:hypothetical protein F8M41_006597 [Gigaspora margarita]|uniref:Uncharacterized protein n=1 Tax=Gigaspora margarita TaxID=4874 RepID=A0A8H4ERA2_GIGMA|nr:hypothetical protein F8M41_006597 [Gigaspora margarita]
MCSFPDSEGALKCIYVCYFNVLSKAEVRTASRDRQPPTTKNKTRPHDIPNGKRRFDLAKASVLLFFHGLGASSSTAALGLLGAFSSEAWLRGLPLRRFGT